MFFKISIKEDNFFIKNYYRYERIFSFLLVIFDHSSGHVPSTGIRVVKPSDSVVSFWSRNVLLSF